MSSRIAILGAEGRLGRALAEEFQKTEEVALVPRRECDLLDLAAVEALIPKLAPEVLFYAAGMTSLEKCEAHPRDAVVTNTTAPEILAAACAREGIRMVYFSTDYVFGGQEPGLKKEADLAAPLSVYGMTKLAGERMVLAADPSHLVFRVSWLFGPHGHHFARSICEKALRREPIEAVADKISSPTSTPDAAVIMRRALERKLPGGLYHLCNQGACSWADYARGVLEVAAAAGRIPEVPPVAEISLVDLEGLHVSRPLHSAMDSSKLAGELGWAIRPWKESLEEMMQKYQPLW